MSTSIAAIVLSITLPVCVGVMWVFAQPFLLHRISRQFRPERIYLIRHAESEGQVDQEVYCRKPDHRVEITAKGMTQAEDCGRRLSEMIGAESCRIFHSPYTRCVMTTQGITKHVK